ncbi:MAG: protein-glutamate O-methyltransferase CheR, partial [Bacteroidales bacterium]|nr:protein-glutamate O-methyltransferase CheR [Bacteroidales bacterium]
MNNKILENILEHLYKNTHIDFRGYRESMLERRIQKRLYATHQQNHQGYLDLLLQNPEELDQLIDVFTINVSSFFRNPLAFELIRKLIIPEILSSNYNTSNHIRIWSAGCSYGEEPYSIALILREYSKKLEEKIRLNIFATDIDKKALEKAKL